MKTKTFEVKEKFMVFYNKDNAEITIHFNPEKTSYQEIENALRENENLKHFYFMGILQGHNGIPEEKENSLKKEINCSYKKRKHT